MRFVDGWLVYYNNVRPHEGLEGKTPAEVAHVQGDVRNWKELTQLPISKEAELKTHKPTRLVVTPRASLKVPHLALPKEPRHIHSQGISRDVLISNVGGGHRIYSHRRIRGAMVIGRIRGGRR